MRKNSSDCEGTCGEELPGQSYMKVAQWEDRLDLYQHGSNGTFLLCSNMRR